MKAIEKLNYLLRPNKAVERKIILHMMQTLSKVYDFGSYPYVGMGSIWFVDFILFHKLLGIQEMYSIEGKAPKRAEFNKPFKTLKVIGKWSTDALKEELVPVLTNPSIIWLDYESTISPFVLEDLDLATRSLQKGSILIVTLNCDPWVLESNLDPQFEDLDLRERLQKVSENLYTSDEHSTVTKLKKEYPTILSRIAGDAIVQSLHEAGSSLTFQPFFNFSYSDGTDMITIGGMIGDDEDLRKVDSLSASLPFLNRRPLEQVEIHVPPLTPYEKSIFDSQVPCESFDAKSLPKLLRGEFDVKVLDAYRRLYKYYPVYFEISP